MSQGAGEVSLELCRTRELFVADVTVPATLGALSVIGKSSTRVTAFPVPSDWADGGGCASQIAQACREAY